MAKGENIPEMLKDMNPQILETKLSQGSKWLIAFSIVLPLLAVLAIPSLS